MGKIIFRLLFKFAKRLVLKKLESMLADYIKDKYAGLLDVPETPEFGEVPSFPTIGGDKTQDGESAETKDESENIKTAVATKIGMVAVGLVGLGSRVSDSETRDAVRDLDSVAEDWNVDLLPIALTVGREATKQVDTMIKTGEGIEFTKFEYTLPTLPKFEPFEPFECRISPKLYSGGADTNEAESIATAGNTSGMAAKTTTATYAPSRWSRKSTGKGAAVDRVTATRVSGKYEYGTSRIFGERTVVAREGDALSNLFEYTRSVDRKIRGAEILEYIDEIIIHCTADHEGTERSAQYIDNEHRKRTTKSGAHWLGMGYHYLIHLDGTIESGRSIRYKGSHCLEGGHNHHSIGIAYVGGLERNSMKPKDTRTPAQKRQIWNLVLYLQKVIPTITEVHGHREFCNKACPSFDVKKEWKELKDGRRAVEQFVPNQGAVAASGYVKSTSQHVDDIYSQEGEKQVVVTNDV